MGFKQSREYKILANGLWHNNAQLRMVLGLCSTLAVTNSLDNSLAMSAGVMFVTVSSSSIISAMRRVIPPRVRLAVFMMIISTFTIVVDQCLRAFYPGVSAALGPYVGLIITNCVVMGRAEGYAISNPVYLSALDAFAATAGYSCTLLLIAAVRESMGFGTLFGWQVLGSWWTPWVIMVLAPGAFFVLAIYIWILRSVFPEKKK
jgi:Na+-transporting NADH:ubiquinone oxidoreductase subunit D